MSSGSVYVGNRVTFAIDPDTPASDAFGRLRVSDPQNVFDNKSIYDKNPLFWSEYQSGGAPVPAWQANKTQVDITVTGASQRSLRQTKEYFTYQPGKSLFIKMTGYMSPSTRGLTQRIGYFDDQNGIWFQMDENGMSICKRSYTSGVAVDTIVYHDDWHVPGGHTRDVDAADFTYNQVFWIDAQWLGVGRVRCGVTSNAGVPIVLHQFEHANETRGVYMTSANLPVRYEAITDANYTAGTSTLTQICTAVESEGGYHMEGITFSKGRTSVVTAASGTRTYLMSLRLKSARNRATAHPVFLDMVSGLRIVYWELIMNPTIVFSTPASYESASFSLTEGAIEADTTGLSTNVTGGYVVASGFISAQTRGAQSDFDSLLKIVADYAGTSDVLALCATGIGGTSDCYSSMHWREFV